MAATFSSLDKLLNNLRSTNHTFKVTTDIFPNLEVEKLSKEMELAELGASRGTEELPSKNTVSMDEIELKVVERIEDAKSIAFNNIEDQLHLFSVRIANLDFQGQFSTIEKVNAESLTDFKGEVVYGKGQLHTLRRELNQRDKDLAAFRKSHKIERSAIKNSKSSNFLKISIIFLIIVLEWIGNGYFLAEGNRLGFIGGVVISLMFALLNVMGTFVITKFGITNLVHNYFSRKLLGYISLSLFVAFAITLSLALAHYRELSSSLVDNVGSEVIQRLKNDPLGLQDLNSWVLFGLGILSSVIIMIDTLYLGDPYMGYQAVSARRDAAEAEYKSTQEYLIDKLIEVRDIHHERVEDIIENLHKRRTEHSAILAHRAKLISLFAEYQSQLERCANQLLRKYRDANLAARSTNAPKHFNSSFTLKRMKPTQDKSGELSSKQIAIDIKKSQIDLTEQIKAISIACDEGIAEYHELDNLFPDSLNG